MVKSGLIRFLIENGSTSGRTYTTPSHLPYGHASQSSKSAQHTWNNYSKLRIAYLWEVPRENMEYGGPSYSRNGAVEVGFASQKHFIGLYILRTDMMKTHRDQLKGKGVSIGKGAIRRSEEHTSELQSLAYLVCRLLLEKKKLTAFHNYVMRRDSGGVVIVR